MADTFRTIIQQSESAKQNVEQQAQQQRASVEQQSKESQESLRKQESELERQVQEAKKDVAEQQVMSKRQSQLAGKKEVKYEAQRQAKEILPQIEKAEAEIKAEIKATKKEVEKAKEEALKDIEIAATDVTGQIKAQQEESLGKLSELQKDNVELDYKDTEGNNQWVAKDFYESLDSDKQSYLNKNGLDAFKSKYYHETKDGQLIDREYYNSLSSEDKKYLDSNGLSAFNELLVDRSYEQYTELRESRGEEVQYTLEQWRNATSEFRERRLVLNQYGAYKDTALNAGGNVDDIATQQEWLDMSDDERQKAYEKMTGKFYVTLSTGDIVPENYYDSLTSEQQAQLNKLGVDGYRIANTVTLKNGELIDRTYYESLTTEQQKQINDVGVNEFQYKMYVDMATSGNASYISRTEWDARSESDRQDLINRTADLINYTIYRGNASVLGVQPMTITEWQSQTESTRNYILTETQYNIYKGISEGGGITPVSLTTYLNSTPEGRIQFYEVAINDGYVSSPKTGELYPKNRFNELTDKQQEAFNTGGAEGLQVVISNDLWDSMNQIYSGISSATGIQSNPYTQQQWDGMTYEQKQNAYNNTLNTYSAFILTQTNATIGQINQVTGGNVPLYTTDQWDNMDFAQQQDTYASTIDKYGDSLYNTYADNVKFINENTAQNIILLNQSDWNNLPTEQQIKAYNDIGDKLEVANAQIINNYIDSLPSESQAYIKTYGMDKFNEAYQTALSEQAAGRDITSQLQVIGLVPDYAENVTINEAGEVTYEGSPNYKKAQTIDLNSIDYNNLTMADYYRISKTLRQSEKYDNLSYRDAVIRYANRELKGAEQIALKELVNAHDRGKFVDVVSFIVPVAQLLKADVTMADKDVNNLRNWLISIASIATILVSPLTGAVIKGAGSAAKAITAASKGASVIKGVQTGAFSIFGGDYIVSFKDMSTTEKLLNGALLLGFAGALYGKPITNAIKTLGSKTAKALSSQFSIMASELKNISKIVKAGDVARLEAAGQRLQSIGEKLQTKNYTTGTTIYEQGRFISNNAEAIIGNAKKVGLSKANEKWLNDVALSTNKSLGASAGKIPDDIKAQGEKWVKAREEADKYAFDIKGTKYEGRISEALPKWQQRGISEGMFRQSEIKPQELKQPMKPETKPLKSAEEGYLKTQSDTAYLKALSEQENYLKTLDKAKAKVGDYARARLLEKYQNQKALDLEKTLKSFKQAEIIKQETNLKVAKEQQLKANYPQVLNKWVVEMKRVQQIRVRNAIDKVLNEIKSKELSESMKLTGDATPIEIAATKAQISATNAENVLAQAQNMSANEAIKYMLRSNMITAAIAQNANVFINIFSQANNQVQASVLSRVSPALAKQLQVLANEKVSTSTKAKAKTEAQAIAKTEIKTATSILTAAATSTQSMIKQISKTIAETIAKTNTKTDLDTKAEIDTKVNAATKAITDSQLKADIKNEVKSQVESLVKTMPAEATKTSAKTDVKTDTKTETKVSTKASEETKTKTETKPITIAKPIDAIKAKEKIKIFKTIKLPNGKTVGFTKEQWKGKVGWKQGLFYWLIYPPYGENDKIVTRKKIAGIPYFSGIKSAYRSIIKLGGKVPYKIFRDFGIFDIEITTPRKGNKPTIKYIPDYKQKTKRTGRTVGELSSLK